MAKISGLGAHLYVAQYDISGDVGAVNGVETNQAQQDVSSIEDLAAARIGLRRDGSLGLSTFWNVAAGQQHPVLSALPRTDVIGSFFVGSTVGSAAASINAKQGNYAVAYGEDGSLGVTTTLSGSGYGLEWSGGGTGDGMLTTGKQSFATGTVSGASIDLGSVSTLFGAAAYLHVFTMPSGTLTVTIEDSANDSAFAAVTGMTFTNLTAPGSERVQGAINATVRRYVRVTCSGVHGTSLLAVNFIRYLTNPNT